MKQIPDRPIPEDVKFANAGIWLAQSLLMPSNEPTPDSLVGYIRAEEARDKKAAVNTFAAKAQRQRRHRVLRSLSKRTGGNFFVIPKIYDMEDPLSEEEKKAVQARIRAATQK